MNPKLYWLSNASHGQIAISARPRGGDWLEDEVEGWRRQGINVIVSLLTDSENRELDLRREADIATEKGIQFYSLPIQDRGVPSSLSSIENLATELHQALSHDNKVAIHCRQGIGRSSLVAAAVLMTGGDDLDRSLKIIREARGVEVPETREQREWLNQFAKAHAADALG